MKVLLLLIYSVLTPCEVMSSEFLADIEYKVDQFIMKGMLCHNNPGLSLSVVRDNKVLLAKGYGFKSTDKLEPVTNQTLFGIASLSKAFAATLMLKQIEENKNLSLATTVKNILGKDDCFYGYLRSRYATLEDLLAHRLGIPGNNNIRLDHKLTRANLIERLKYLKPVGGFRTSFYYNNLIYGLVTYLSEVIGKSKWEDLVRTKLFEPLQMKKSTFSTTANPDQLDLAKGYVDRDGNLLSVPWEFTRRWGELCGSGCIFSNAVDMAHWMMFHLNEGRNAQNKPVVDADILEHAHKAQNSISSSTFAKYYFRPLTPVTFSTDNYGLGWKLGYYRGLSILSHSGSTYGYRAFITLIPKLKTGIFTAMTGEDPSFFFRANLQQYIVDLISSTDPWLDPTILCSFPEPWQRKKGKTSTSFRKDIEAARSLYSYEGLYKNQAYGEIDVYFNKTSGHLTAVYGFGIFDLYPKSTPDNFFAEAYGIIANIKDMSTVKFEIGNKGSATAMVIPSMESKSPPEFKRIGEARTQRHAGTNSANSCSQTMHVFVFGPLCIMLFRNGFV